MSKLLCRFFAFSRKSLYISLLLFVFMSDATIEHMHNDMEDLKKDIAVIKHILSEEGKFSEYTKEALAEARATPDSEYISHKELKKRIMQ